MSRSRVRVVATALGLGMCLIGCDACRPGIDPLPLDHAKLVKIEPGWFVFGGQSDCGNSEEFEDTCGAWVESRRDDAAIPWRLAYLTGYRIDQREVTNREYLECMQTEDSRGEPICGRPDDCGNVPILAEMAASIVPEACPMAHEDVAFEPVRNVSWLDARRFCKWRHDSELADLPTEAQWERAAVGPAIDGQPFTQPVLPIASEPERLSCATVVISTGGSCVEDSNNASNEVYNSEPHPYVVTNEDGETYRTESKSPAGLLDMTGNVAEWTLDASDEGEESHCDLPFLGAEFSVSGDCHAFNEEAECQSTRTGNIDHVDRSKWCNPMIGKQDLDISSAEINLDRVVKGGDYTTKKWCDATPRARYFELEPDSQIGFRCAIWDHDPGLNPHAMCPDPVGADAPPTAFSVPDAGVADSGDPDSGAEDI